MNIVDRIISPNIWDEIYTVSGGFIYSSFIKVDANANVYIKAPSYCTIYFYGEDKVQNATPISNIQNTSFNVYSNTAYIRFSIVGTVYNHNICINESNPSINGKYFPYVMYKRYDIVDLIHTHNLWNKTVKYNQNVPNDKISGSNPVRDTRTTIYFRIGNNTSPYTPINISTNISSIGSYSFIFTSTFTGNYRVYHDGAISNITFLQSFPVINGHKYLVQIKITSLNMNVIGELKWEDFHICDLTKWFKANIPQALLDEPSTFNEYWNGELPYDTGTDVLPNNSIKRLKIGG